MDGLRRSALALHGLAEADRRWMLDQLPAPERARLVDLLEEVRSLGIPPDPSVLARLKEAVAPAAPPVGARLREASVGGMLALLAREPAALVAAVLRARAWPWKGAFLARLEPVLREKVLGMLREPGPVPPALAAAALACVEARLRAEARAEPESVARRAGRYARRLLESLRWAR